MISTRLVSARFGKIATLLPFAGTVCLVLAILASALIELDTNALIVGSFTMVLLTLLPAGLWGLLPSTQREVRHLPKVYSLSHYGAIAIDGANWAFFFGSVGWAVLGRMHSFSNVPTVQGHLIATGIGFLLTSIFCARRWVNAMAEDARKSRIYNGRFDKPGVPAEGLLLISGVILIMSVTSPTPLVTFWSLAVSTVLVLLPTHFFGCYLFTVLITRSDAEDVWSSSDAPTEARTP